MAIPTRIYLAGPEVFFPSTEHRSIVTEKKRLLASAGLVGVDPMDADLRPEPTSTKRAQGLRIYRANRALMDDCAGVIANLTPFRGVSADPGTVWEVGYMIGQGKPAVGFTLDARVYAERVGSVMTDSLGHVVEDFGLSDNLMIEGGLSESGGGLVIGQSGHAGGYFDSKVFERCVAQILAALKPR